MYMVTHTYATKDNDAYYPFSKCAPTIYAANVRTFIKIDIYFCHADRVDINCTNTYFLKLMSYFF